MIPTRPLKRLVVNGLTIPADMLQAEVADHDLDEATLTVTFCNVRTVETVYKDMEPDR